MPDHVIAQTANGQLRGARIGGAHAFKGIQYGTPTGGAARFRPPQPVEPWTGIRGALDYGARSPQSEGSFPLAPQVGDLVTPLSAQPIGEDCLVLNLWTPALRDGGKRPVLVWLHGGAFITGSGADPWAHGVNFCQRQDVVVVTLNHRLGACGYLHLEDIPGLDGDFAGAGLAGMFDIIAALAWIRDNIAEFGGDPGNVTLFGQSGGGGKVCVLMAMPKARGLFHKAIVQSGPALKMAERQDGTDTATAFLAELGLRPEQAEELRKLPLERLMAAQQKVIARAGMASFADRRRVGFNPVSGLPDFPAGPFEPEAPALSADIPLLIGTNKDEMTIFFAMEPWLASLDDRQLGTRLQPYVGALSATLAREYRRLYPAAPAGELFVTIIGDFGITLPSFQIADRKAAQKAAPVYGYLFQRESPALQGRLRSCHIVEIPYVFDTLEDAAFIDRTAADAKLSRTVSAIWAEFARSGKPAAPGLPAWPAYAGEERATMLLDLDCRVERDPYRQTRQAWAAAGRS